MASFNTQYLEVKGHPAAPPAEPGLVQVSSALHRHHQQDEGGRQAHHVRCRQLAL